MRLFKSAPTNRYNSPEIILILGDLNNVLNTLSFPCKHIHIWMFLSSAVLARQLCRSGHTVQTFKLGGQPTLQGSQMPWASHLYLLIPHGVASESLSRPAILLRDFFLSFCLSCCFQDGHSHSLAFLTILTHTFRHVSPLCSEADVTLRINTSLN